MKIEEILAKMSLKDKIALCSGANFWETKKLEQYGIPSLFLSDGPHGLRKQENTTDMLGINNSRPATCFPAEVTTAGSWDPELLERIGTAIAQEAIDQGVALVLGPGVNLKRNPLCGRSFEYFSEDPYLAGKLAAGFITGVEGQGIGTSLKHFAANSQELSRFTSDSVMDQRTLRELYLPAFELAVKEGHPASVMCAYPKLNGIHCSDHRQLLTQILRDEWGFDGLVVTDWGAMNHRVEAFRAGCDLSMPGGSAYMEKDVLKAVKSGALDESAVDDCARRVLKLAFRPSAAKNQQAPWDNAAHHALAKEAAEAGAVLLKNEDALLPLGETAKIAVLGAMAKSLRYQGSGSSHINPLRVSQPLDHLPGAAYAPGCDDRGNTTDQLLAQAAATARDAEVALVFVGLPDQDESEGFDRTSLQMPEGHLRLVDAVAEANPNTVVVLCGGVVECPWADKVKAILYMGLPGQAGGEAIADLLYGRANPSGRLAESWPLVYEDVPSSPVYGKNKDALYLEGIYVGYRYYEKAGKAVRWPFGFGLSYTEFACSDLQVEGRTASVTVANVGSRAGAQVVQLYVAAPQQGLHRPLRELKGFQKVFLQPGESRRLSFVLDDRAFALWQEGWKVPGGTYTIQIGELSAPVQIEGEELPAPAWQKDSFYEACQGKPDQAQWEAMLGRRWSPPELKKGQFTVDNTVEEMRPYSWVMRLVYRIIEQVIRRRLGGKDSAESPEYRMMMTAAAGGPLRNLQITAGLRGSVIQGLLAMANGHFLRGLGRMLRG